jgi:hypothetical protein
MAASEAAIAAVMEALRCRPEGRAGDLTYVCAEHITADWDERGCSTARATAQAAVDADRARIHAEALRELADWGDANRDYYYWGYDGISDIIRARADRIEGKP